MNRRSGILSSPSSACFASPRCTATSCANDSIRHWVCSVRSATGRSDPALTLVASGGSIEESASTTEDALERPRLLGGEPIFGARLVDG